MAQSGEAPAQSMAEHVQETASAEIPSHRWVLKYGDKVYGPYTYDAMKGYVAEGRVAEHSLIAPEGTPAGASMWQYAVDIPAFTKLFAATPDEQTLPAEEPAGENTGTAADEPAGETADMRGDAAGNAVAAEEPAQQPTTALRRPTLEPAAEGQRPAYGPGKGQIDRRRQPDTANFIIVMDIKARFAGPLEQAIMSLGPAYKLAPNVWCVNTDATAAGLLTDLSQHIGRTDTMFIADTTRDRTAWSSMGPEVDAKIRRVWRRTY